MANTDNQAESATRTTSAVAASRGHTTTNTLEPELARAAAIAAMLGISRTTWLQAVQTGRAPDGIKILGSKLWHIEEVRAWAAAGAPSARDWSKMRKSSARGGGR